MNGNTHKTKKATIYDVAKFAGTSAATVSRVLSNSGYPVKEEMRRKILSAAEKLSYSPNMVGRMLKKSESNDIGVIIPTISNPFYPQMILGIELEARKRGYNILLCNSFRDPGTEMNYIHSLYQKQVKGIIVSSIGENHNFLTEMQQNGVEVVAFDQDIASIKCSKVGFDFIKGGLLAIDYLVQMGHKEIAFLTSPLTRKSRRDVMEGYKIGLLKNGLQYREDLVIVSEYESEYENGIYEYENGKNLAKKLMDSGHKPTAIFALNDMTAFGIMKEFLNNGIRIPEDISIIGFDNIEFSSMIHPSLTTINQPAFETGKMACKILIDSMEQGESRELSISLEPTLIIRNSVKELEG